MPPSLPRCSPPFRLSCTPPGGPDGGQLEDTVRLLGRELARPQIATSLVLERLVDVLLVQALR
jgi:hypothetical protein